MQATWSTLRANPCNSDWGQPGWVAQTTGYVYAARGHNRKSNRKLPFKMLLILVANPKGMRKYAVQHKVAGLSAELDRRRWDFYSWMGDTQPPRRRRNQRPPQLVIRATLPPAAPLHTPVELPALDHHAAYPRLLADPSSITDGTTPRTLACLQIQVRLQTAARRARRALRSLLLCGMHLLGEHRASGKAARARS